MPDATRTQVPPWSSVSGYQPLTVVLSAFAVGILWDRFLPVLGLSYWLLVAAWLATILCLGLWRICWGRAWDRVAMGLLFVSIVMMGTMWHHTRWRLFAAWDLGRFARAEMKPTCVEGIALFAPRHVPAPLPDPLRPRQVGDRSRLDVEITAIRDGTTWRPACGTSTLLVDGHLLGVAAGDRLRIFAQLSRPFPARNPGQFDFARYARGNRQLSVLRCQYPDCVRVIQGATGRYFRRAIDRLRTLGGDLLWGQLSRERSGLAAALLLGAREQVGAERTEAFMTTGTVHLLVVSGLHLGILAGGLFAALRLGVLPRRPALMLVACMVVTYAFLTDARPPVLRAAVLVVVVCLARVLGREILAFNSLAAAALLVLLCNPADLFRTGPQLSFLAVAALSWYAGRPLSGDEPLDPLDRLIAETRSWPLRLTHWLAHWGWAMTMASIIVWFVLAPLVMARFHLLTPIAVLLAPLLWLPVAVCLLSGFATLLLGWLVPPLGSMAAWFCDHSLQLIEFCVNHASALPGNHVWVPGPANWWLVGFYGVLGLFVAFPRLCPPRRWCVGMLAGWIAIGLVVGTQRRSDKSCLHCTFLAVGHGCAVVLEMPRGETILYDTGSLGSPHYGAQTIASYLWSQGITRLDAVVLSHADVDHYNALPELLDRFQVGVVLVSTTMFAGDAPGPRELHNALKRKGIPIRQVWAGDRLTGDSMVDLQVLHPPPGGVPGSDNANSIVIALEFAGRRVLLPGDLEPPGLDDLVAELPVDCDVLLAPHHGSIRSDPVEFAEWSRPEWVVVSGGLKQESEEVRTAYEAAGARMLHTAQCGAIRFTLSRSSVELSTWVDDPP